jgi:hypothetical protein
MPRAMKRSTEKMIAVQLLTLIVAVTALLLAQLLGGTRHAQAPAHLLSWHGITASTASPWHSLRRLIHRKFWAARDEPGATVARQPPPPATAENSRAQ